MNKTTELRNVLFVCVHKSGRSQMTKAFFNHLAKGKGRAILAGTAPADAVNPAAVAVMREVGIDISGNNPKPLTRDMLEQADIVVTMGCGAEGVCQATFVETQDRELEDPEGKPLPEVRRIRDEIRTKVVELLKMIEHNIQSQIQDESCFFGSIR